MRLQKGKVLHYRLGIILIPNNKHLSGLRELEFMNIIEFDSYLLINKLPNKPVSKIELPNYFKSISEDLDRIKKDIAKFSPIIEDQVIYLDGAIRIKFNNQILIDFDYWDDITTLWHFYLNVLADCLTTGEGECYFPNQSITIKMINLQNDISFQVGEITKVINKKVFVQQLLSGAQKYYNFTKTLLGTDVELELYNRILQIEKITICF